MALIKEGKKPVAMKDISPLLEPFKVGANKALDVIETKKPAVKKIPVGRTTEPTLYSPSLSMIRSGLSDPAIADVTPRELYRADDKVSEPTPVLARLAAAAPQFIGTAKPGNVKTQSRGILSGLFTTADVVNDVNTRVARARQWRADDPRTESDDPVYEYTSPDTSLTMEQRTYVDDDKVHYYTLPSGQKVTSEQLGDLAGSKPTKAEQDQVIASATWAYTTDPNGMVIRSADGSESKDAQQIGKRQIGSGYKMSATGQPMVDSKDNRIPAPINKMTGVAEPRAPYEDTAGDPMLKMGALGVPFLPKLNPDYDITQSAANEVLPWMADLNLGSAPYYIPKYRYISAAAASLPYLAGYEGGTYVPAGRDIEDLGKTGLGAYTDNRDLSYAQMFGGAMAPPVDAWVEKASGSTFGGLQDIPLVKKLIPERFRDSFGEKLLFGMAGEGGEEVASAPFNQIADEGLRDWGKDSYINDVTGETVYRPTDPFGRLTNVANYAGDNFMAGALMTGPMVTGSELGKALKNRYNNSYVAPREIPVNPRTSEE